MQPSLEEVLQENHGRFRRNSSTASKSLSLLLWIAVCNLSGKHLCIVVSYVKPQASNFERGKAWLREQKALERFISMTIRDQNILKNCHSYSLIQTSTCTYPGARNGNHIGMFCALDKWMIPSPSSFIKDLSPFFNHIYQCALRTIMFEKSGEKNFFLWKK